ncbi:MAG: dTDP-4-dehydrorhamnose reductase [Verrucomicrobia bacterium]|jgi:dTDP-4-dehydrorhamnose reductase|nr:dTDP-4-dehydrorhamnose reductase [Verrucomicrobiota bacterium]MBT7065983.1 dTDP-4-dehydrorhamnose reductase [Verrucomicrobiota bacterium]MBT7699287.1 dTDP-4-dehydrorhamnose reductase [Verrucomicrobiota bacterium]
MIWVTGSKGMLGTDLVAALKREGHAVLETDIEVDVCYPQALMNAAEGHAIDWVINCCAYTAVDKAESDETQATALNSDGAANIASVARTIGARMIHISTDYVFDGLAEQPYVETDPVSPIGVYARTKELGERRVTASAPNAFILRTAWLYGAHGGNFVYSMLRLMGERETLGVVADQEGSPTWTQTLCRVIAEMIKQDVTQGGIYHVTNRGRASWHEFAAAIHAQAIEHHLLSRPCKVNPISTEDYPTPARRPPCSVLNCRKIEALLNIQLPTWQESLAAFIAVEAAATQR